MSLINFFILIADISSVPWVSKPFEKKYLNSKKIKAHERSTLLFLCQNSEVLWAIGYGISEKIKVMTKPNYVLSLEKSEA